MEATPLTTEQQDIATKLQALSFGTQAEQEQVIIKGARLRNDNYVTHARKWNPSFRFTWAVNTATRLAHNDKCEGESFWARLTGRTYV